MTDTDVLVIGGGPGGYHAAIRAAQLGKDVICVDKGSFGGVCLHWGCIPSKGLIGVGKLVDEVRAWQERGLQVDGLGVDLAQVQAWKAEQIDQQAKGVRFLLKSRGVEVREGRCVLTGPDQAVVNDEETITFKKAILATGSHPVELPHIPFDHTTVLSSRSALELEEVPGSMLVIGGGFIGLEIGQLYHQLGAEVTVVEMMDSLLPTADAEISKTLQRELKKRGVTARTGTKAAGCKVTDAGAEVQLETGGGDQETLHVDKVLVAVGRRPNTAELGLEAAGVQVDDHGLVQVNDQMRTSNEAIFAIGDITPGPGLAHKASFEGTHAAAVAAGQDDVVVDHRAIPWFCYTTPEVGSVGLTEAEARDEHGDDLIVGQFPFRALGKAKMAGHIEGFCKVIADEREAILGVHIVGPDATNLIQEPALAIEMGATLTDIAETVHAHPTLAEIFREAVEVAQGHPIHVNQ